MSASHSDTPDKLFIGLRGLSLIAARRIARQDRSSDPVPAPCVDGGSLAMIGLGPGMQLRLGQLAINSVADLAAADASRLRSDLGEISRLIDVEGWIRDARQARPPG